MSACVCVGPRRLHCCALYAADADDGLDNNIFNNTNYYYCC